MYGHLVTLSPAGGAQRTVSKLTSDISSLNDHEESLTAQLASAREALVAPRQQVIELRGELKELERRHTEQEMQWEAERHDHTALCDEVSEEAAARRLQAEAHSGKIALLEERVHTARVESEAEPSFPPTLNTKHPTHWRSLTP